MTSAERNRRYKVLHPDRVRAQRHAYRAANIETLRAKSRDRERSRRERARRDVLTAFGGCCARCGFSDYRALQIDHVNDDGYVDKEARLDWVKFARRAVKEIASGRFQLLCANCNWIKKREHEERCRQQAYARRPTPRQPRRPFGDIHFSLVTPERVVRGENHYLAKLKEKDVCEIRASDASAKVLADKFGVSTDLIYRVRRRLSWRHVP